MGRQAVVEFLVQTWRVVHATMAWAAARGKRLVVFAVGVYTVLYLCCTPIVPNVPIACQAESVAATS